MGIINYSMQAFPKDWNQPIQFWVYETTGSQNFSLVVWYCPEVSSQCFLGIPPKIHSMSSLYN
jgi:hypothetical protein